MTTLTLHIQVQAPPERCYNLARSMDFHTWSMRATGECIVSGRATGLIDLNEDVEFEGRHLGLTRRLRARITQADPPRTFTDAQTRGPFRSLAHLHTFEPLSENATRITDTITLHVGWGPAGLLAERLIVAPHLRRVVANHQRNLKQTLESDAWRRFLV